MRRRIYITMAAMALIALSAALPAKARTSSRLLIANIPFEFNVGNATLPAGEYTVRRISPASAGAVVLLRTKDGRASAMVVMSSVIGKERESARLIFHRYGNRYFFAQAWDGDNTGLQAPKSRAERAMQRELAGMKSRIEEVALTTSR